MYTKLLPKYVTSKVDYFNINAGDLCQLVDDEPEGIFIKVVKVGMQQVHYLYNFEWDLAEPTKEELWKAAITPLVYFLAATPSISAGRSYNDILLMIDGGEMPTHEQMSHRGDLAPTIFSNELFKLLEGTEVESKDDMVDSLLDGEMSTFARDLFIEAFYICGYPTLLTITQKWDSFRDVVTTAHKMANEE